MGHFDINPFDRSALTEYRLLAGRANEFRQVRFVLRSAANNQDHIKSIMLSGDRGVGKTSFLNLIENECPSNNIVPIRINLTEGNSKNSHEFFWYLFTQASNKAFELKLLGGKGGAVDLSIQRILHAEGLSDPVNYVFRSPILRKQYLTNNQPTFEFDQFIEDMKLIRGEVINSNIAPFDRKSKLLFLVDESQYLYSNPSIIEDIRYVIQHHELGIGFVFAGDSSYSRSHWESVFGGTHREFELLNLNYFDDVSAVKDYFTKSLQAIGWSLNEIEESYFYKFNVACRQIYQLTSGKPAWINTIAGKMFERCMTGEAKLLKFDRNAQNDVKQILAASGELDNKRLDYIAQLSETRQKWLAEIVSCEASTLRRVYFYAKFLLSDANALNFKEYEEFCLQLIVEGIILIVEAEDVGAVGFTSSRLRVDTMDKPFVVFGYDAGTMKQWLQISSEGRYRFKIFDPELQFITQVNKRVASEDGNLSVYTGRYNRDETPVRLRDIVTRLGARNYNIKDEPYQVISFLYKFCKISVHSKERSALYCTLKDNKSGGCVAWNLFNHDDKERLIGYFDPSRVAGKLGLAVDGYNDERHDFSIELAVDKLPGPDLQYLEKCIIESNNTKLLGMILDDKMEDLMRYYILESNVESSYQTALSIYQIHEAGHDLRIRDLNNTAYIFLAKDELDPALALLLEAERRVAIDSVGSDELSHVRLVLYNLGIAYLKKGDYPQSLSRFKRTIEFIAERDMSDEDDATVLDVLELRDDGTIRIIEIKQSVEEYPKISCAVWADHNVAIIEQYLAKEKQ